MALQIECTKALHNIVNRDSQTDWIREKKALRLHEEKIEQHKIKHKNVWIIFVYVKADTRDSWTLLTPKNIPLPFVSFYVSMYGLYEA